MEPHLASDYTTETEPAADGVGFVPQEQQAFEAGGPAPLSAMEVPRWLVEVVRAAQHSPRQLPEWALPTNLPPLLLGTRNLRDDQVYALLTSLSQLTGRRNEGRRLREELRAAIDRASLARFLLTLFQHWDQAGASPRAQWAFVALALSDDPSVAQHLAALAVGRRTKQPYLAQECLKLLGMIGTDVALRLLAAIAGERRNRKLCRPAAKEFERAAQAQSLSRAQLEDRLVLDLGFDADGRRSFSYGWRHIHVVLDENLQPFVRDETGRLRPTLPGVTRRDDPALARQTREEWGALKKQLAAVMKFQVTRLEQAMVTGHCWTRAEFEAFILRHPLMSALARRLIWQVVGTDGPGRAFRVTEDRNLADSAERPLVLLDNVGVRIVHPFHLDAAERQCWGELLTDYAIHQPFAQLARDVTLLGPSELMATMLARCAATPLPALRLLGALSARGWTRDATQSGHPWRLDVRLFPEAALSAVIKYEPGVNSLDPAASEAQRITQCYFTRGVAIIPGSSQRWRAVTLERVDPPVLRAVLDDLAAIMEKQRP